MGIQVAYHLLKSAHPPLNGLGALVKNQLTVNKRNRLGALVVLWVLQDFLYTRSHLIHRDHLISSFPRFISSTYFSCLISWLELSVRCWKEWWEQAFCLVLNLREKDFSLSPQSVRLAAGCSQMPLTGLGYCLPLLVCWVSLSWKSVGFCPVFSLHLLRVPFEFFLVSFHFSLKDWHVSCKAGEKSGGDKSSVFVYLGLSNVLLHFWRIVGLSVWLLGWPLLPALWACHPDAFWPRQFPISYQLLMLLRIPWMEWDISLLLCSRFFVFVFWQFN